MNPTFLDPVSAERFFAEHWGRSRLAIHRGDPRHFGDLIGMEELDRIVTSIRVPVTNFNLARGDTPLPLSAYTSDGSYVDKRRALDLHRDGATIILRSVEQWSPGLNRLRIAAEEFFGFEAQTNVYLTPPSEKSTPPHWDTHDLFVIQVEGSKRWRLFPGDRTLPLGDERFRIDADHVGSEVEEVVLHAGDTLYLPRGFIHEPVAESYSVHVSLGIHTHRWYDLVDVALRLLAGREGSALRETVPHGEAVAAPPPGMLADLLSPDLLREAAAVLRRNFAAGRAVDLEGRLLEIQRGPRLDAGVRYTKRPGIVLRTEAAGDAIRLAAGTQQVSVGPRMKDAVDYIAANRSFTAAELPGGISTDERVALCVALQDIGVLRADNGVTAAG